MTLLNVGAVVSSLLAAVFWFISAAGKTTIPDKTFGGFLDTPDAIISTLKYSAKWNRLASIFSGFAALFLIALVVNSRHAGTRALVGWYLLTAPPMSGPERAGVAEPISEWNFESSYDSASECEVARKAMIEKGMIHLNPGGINDGLPLMLEIMKSAQCIATDDPRLKRK